MNIHPEIISQISLILYMLCGALYVFISLRYKQYIWEPQHRMHGFWSFIILPFYAAFLKPELDMLLVLTLIQLSFIFALTLGSIFQTKFAPLTDMVFGLLSCSLLVIFAMKTPPAFILTLQLHWIGIVSAILCFATLLVVSLHHEAPLAKSTVAFLTAASVLAAFKGPIEMQLIVQFVYICGLLNWIRLQANALETTFVTSLNKTKKIEKDFNDAVRKEVSKHMFYHELSKDKIKSIAQTDDLTKSLNKKAFLNLSDELIQDKTPFAILMFDIDKFKTINDTLGHIAGDVCLKTLSNIARQCIRDNDSLARYGGDEFIIILPNSDLQNAMRVAERFRISIAKTENPHFTVSIGVACYPTDATDTKGLIKKADDGLYASKNKGRNTISYLK